MKSFLVVGLGSIGMRHAKNLVRLGQRVYGTDPDKKRLDIAEANGVDVTGGNLTEADACIIATPTSRHATDIKYAVTSGYHMFVEKPISSRIHDKYLAVALVESRKRNLVVMVGNNLRFHSCVRYVSEHLKRHIGTPLWAQFVLGQYNDRPDYRRDGVILNWGAHELDLARYLLGDCGVICCHGDDTLADIILLHKSGVCSTVHLDYVTIPEQRWFRITGTDGVLMVDLVYRRVLANNIEVFSGIDTFDDNYFSEMKAFVRAVEVAYLSGPREEGEMWATAIDGLATLKLVNDAQDMAGLK